MKTEARFLLAVLLMLTVLIGTNRLFPPVVPDSTEAFGDSAAAEVEGGTESAASGDGLPGGGLPTGAADTPVEVAPTEAAPPAQQDAPAVDVVVESHSTLALDRRPPSLARPP